MLARLLVPHFSSQKTVFTGDILGIYSGRTNRARGKTILAAGLASWHELIFGRELAITKTVFPKLSGGVSLCLQNLRNSRVFVGQSFVSSRGTSLRQARADRRLSCSEGCTAGGAARLRVPN